MTEVDYTSHLLFAAYGTADAVRTGKKDVTRRLIKSDVCRWRVGRWAKCYARDPRAGGKPFGRVRIINVDRELLSQVDDAEVRREGARAKDREEFRRLFRELHGLPADADPYVWRIEFADFTALAPPSVGEGK